jgi:hypothetical protein
MLRLVAAPVRFGGTLMHRRRGVRPLGRRSRWDLRRAASAMSVNLQAGRPFRGPRGVSEKTACKIAGPGRPGVWQYVPVRNRACAERNSAQSFGSIPAHYCGGVPRALRSGTATFARRRSAAETPIDRWVAPPPPARPAPRSFAAATMRGFARTRESPWSRAPPRTPLPPNTRPATSPASHVWASRRCGSPTGRPASPPVSRPSA